MWSPLYVQKFKYNQNWNLVWVPWHNITLTKLQKHLQNTTTVHIICPLEKWGWRQKITDIYCNEYMGSWTKTHRPVAFFEIAFSKIQFPLIIKTKFIHHTPTKKCKHKTFGHPSKTKARALNHCHNVLVDVRRWSSKDKNVFTPIVRCRTQHQQICQKALIYQEPNGKILEINPPCKTVPWSIPPSRTANCTGKNTEKHRIRALSKHILPISVSRQGTLAVRTQYGAFKVSISYTGNWR